MRRLARWLLNFALLASLACCAASLLLWTIAMPRTRTAGFQWRTYAISCGFGGDGAWLTAVGNLPPGASREGAPTTGFTSLTMYPAWSCPGLHVTRGSGTVMVLNPQGYYSSQTSPVLTLNLHLWLPPLAFGLLALLLGVPWWLLRRARLRRAQAHLCPACGYDLTGNVSGVCPECGTAIHPEPAA